MLSNKIPAESYNELLTLTTQRFGDAEALEREQIAKILLHKAELANIDSEEFKWKEKLGFLEALRKYTFSILKKDQEELSQIETNLTNLKEEVSKIENSTPLQAKESEIFEKIKELLETNLQELSNFKL
ncbi:hypothetical protein ACH5RR_041331 [Cinchona calisaya]|uniref:Uncharacterized protein n=1 Tax=Cinchona calisaya TaxID=153742 RepID=A0ABD2XTG0_9GENT